MASVPRAGEPQAMRRAREIWVQLVRQHEQSGLTQEDYARQRGIPVATLRSWIYKLRRAEDDGAQLLPVRVVASTAPTARQREAEAGEIEVELGEPVRLRFSSSVPPSVIAELVHLLRARC